MLKIKIGEVCDVYDGPHATPKKIDKGPVYLGIDAITDNGIIIYQKKTIKYGQKGLLHSMVI